MRIKIILLSLFLAMPLYAAWDNAGTTSEEFLKIIGSARSVGLGGSYAALDDINNMAVNPALIGYGKCLSAGINYIAFFQDVNYTSLNASWKFNGVDGVSFGLIYLDSGSIQLTGESPDSTGTVNKRDIAVIAGYGREIGSLLNVSTLRNLYLGADLRYFSEGFGDFNHSGLLLDIGAFYQLPFLSNLSVGLSLLNIRFISSDTAPSPFNIKLGGRYDVNFFNWNKYDTDFSFLLDIEKTEGMAPNIAVGVESRFLDMFALRLGYRFLHDTGSISAGLGVTWNGVSFSYSISPFSDLGIDNQFSLSYALDCAALSTVTAPPVKPDRFRIGMNRDCYSLLLLKDVVFDFQMEKTRSVKNWEFTILRKNTALRQYSGSGEPPTNLVWNGRDEKGALLTEGDYTAMMKLSFEAGGETAYQTPIRVDGTRPVVSITADKEIFSPDGDGYEDTLTFLPKAQDFCGVTNWNIRITDLRSNTLRTIEAPGSVPEKVVWDGRDDRSNVIRQMSKYYYTLTVLDGCGNTNSATSTVFLKTDLYLVMQSNGTIMINLEGVQFDTAKYSLRAISTETLNRAVNILSRPYVLKYNVQVEGHTDNQSGYEYNMDLSRNRSKEVMNYLITNGIDTNRLSYEGFGYTRPIADNNTVEGRQMNRRVELILKQP